MPTTVEFVDPFNFWRFATYADIGISGTLEGDGMGDRITFMEAGIGCGEQASSSRMPQSPMGSIAAHGRRPDERKLAALAPCAMAVSRADGRKDRTPRAIAVFGEDRAHHAHAARLRFQPWHVMGPPPEQGYHHLLAQPD